MKLMQLTKKRCFGAAHILSLRVAALLLPNLKPTWRSKILLKLMVRQVQIDAILEVTGSLIGQ